VRKRPVILSVAIQLALAPFLAHGYDFRVSYVAGRNIASGLSPYFGGELLGMFAEGYGPHIQGLGETPLWALYLGLCYLLSAGQPFLFNLLTKLPIIAANLALAYALYSRGAEGWRFFLLNPFLLTVSTTWGKADNVATLLVVVALVGLSSTLRSASTLAASVMVKPLAVAVMPAFIGALRPKPSRAAYYILAFAVISACLFIAPFTLLGWPVSTLVEGLPNWLRPAGGLSPLNVVEPLLGRATLPPSLSWLGYLAPITLLLLTAYAAIRPPASQRQVLGLALLSASLFFSFRPWVSEQNLVLPLTLFLLLGRFPTRLLWVVPLLFMLTNNSLQQQLYLLRPTIVEELYRLDGLIGPFRLWLRFSLSLAWLAVLWVSVLSILRKSDRR